MKRGIARLGLAAFLLLLSACTADKEIAAEPAPPPEPVVDTSPYLCSLVPERAFRVTVGLTKPVTEKVTGTDQNGDCRAFQGASPYLEVAWMQEGPGMPSDHLNLLADDRLNVYTSHGGTALPSELGDGMAAYIPDSALDEQPYRASAKFVCGDKNRLIDIYLAQVSKGRDAIKDLTDLMRIAQKRYAQLHDCDLTP
jgi:hypothetical protein